MPCPSVLSLWVLPLGSRLPNLEATSTSEPALSQGGQERGNAADGVEGGGILCTSYCVLLLCTYCVLLLGLVTIPLDARQSLGQPVVTAQVVAQSSSLRSSDLKPQRPPHTHLPVAYFLSCLCLKRKQEAEQVRVMDNSLIFCRSVIKNFM